jgi:uncharacterized coiled-coil protein SlyX
MNFSYEKGDLKVGITGATADDIVKIMREVLGDQQPEIDELKARVEELTARLRTSSTALQTAITQEKEN